jgi:FtsH-binding integral membrane protein
MYKEEKIEISNIVNDLPNDHQAEKRNEVISLTLNEGNESIEESINAQIRIGFIRKVYGILSVQMIITVILCASTFYPSVKMFMLENMIYFWISLALSIVLVIPLICFKSMSRMVPYNYALLMAWTLCESYLVACCCAVYNPSVVIMAATATLAMTISLTIYAITTERNFTYLGGMLFSSVCGIILLSIFSFFFPILDTFVCILSVLCYSVYLIYDTQLIFGKVGLEYSVDDYIYAAINVYLDIIQLFLNILEIIGRMSNN